VNAGAKAAVSFASLAARLKIRKNPVMQKKDPSAAEAELILPLLRPG